MKVRTTFDMEPGLLARLDEYAKRRNWSRNRAIEAAVMIMFDAEQSEKTRSEAKKDIIGTWWNDPTIDLVKIQNDVFALHGWNGESYTSSWKVTGEHLTQASKEKYDILPLTIERGEDEFEIIGYEVKKI